MSRRTGLRAVSLRAVAWVTPVACLAIVAGVHAQTPVPVFHLYLQDGTALVSYGEYTRTTDRVTFPVPVGPIGTPDALQVVSLPSSLIDWDKTRAEADLVRYTHYAATRGEAEYGALTAEVARVLTDIAATPDAARRLDLARTARTAAADWSRARYGYRAEEVRELVAMLDETMMAAQADLGDRSFSFDLVAMTQPPSGTVPPTPTLVDTLDAARAAARASDVPEERLALQQAILSVLTRRARELPRHWASAVRRDVRARVRLDDRDTRDYAALQATSLRHAARAAERGEVGDVERAIARVRARDQELGRRRPNEMDALAVTLEAYLDAARRRRLEFDRWTFRSTTYREYRNVLSRLARDRRHMRGDLDAIRTRSGPPLHRLLRHSARLDTMLRHLAAATPPQDLLGAHDAMTSALRLQAEAVRLRTEAIRQVSPAIAADASAAAAGGGMLFDGALEMLRRYFERPDRP